MKMTPSRAYKLDQDLKQAVSLGKQNFFLMGRILGEIRANKYHETLGYESFDSYIADPELGLKRSSVYHSINLAETFRLKETSGIGVGKLIALLPHITEENKEEMLLSAKTLSRSDLQIVLYGEKEPHETCPTCNGKGWLDQ